MVISYLDFYEEQLQDKLINFMSVQVWFESSCAKQSLERENRSLRIDQSRESSKAFLIRFNQHVSYCKQTELFLPSIVITYLTKDMRTIIAFMCLLLLANCFDKLVNPNVSQQAQKLYQKLIDNYDRYILSGQTTFNYQDFVSKTGVKPMVQGFDMQNYSPHNPWYNWQPYDDGTVDKAINWYHNQSKGEGIVIFFWHWFSPFGGQLRTSTFYTNYTDFDVSKAVVQNTAEYNATIRDFDAIAVQLKKLQASKIPILWRPLHEAGGKWFWWGAKTNTAAISLYNLMYERFTNYHKINNLIWVWSSPEAQWYPGNLKVDIIGYDSYPGGYDYDCRENIYVQLRKIVQDKKMIQMTENGPIPNFADCFKDGVKWGLFMSWSDLVFSQNTIEHIKDIYSQPYVKKLGQAEADHGILSQQ